MIKIGLIKCSVKVPSISSLCLDYTKKIIKENHESECKVFTCDQIIKLMDKGEDLKEIEEDILNCHAYIWGLPVHCGSISYFASMFLEQFSENMFSKIHGLVVSAGSPHFFMAYRDFCFQVMVSTNSIVLPRPAFICTDDINEGRIPEKSQEKIQEMIGNLLKYAPYCSRGLE